MAEKFTATIVAIPMEASSGYDHPTGITLFPEEGDPAIIVAPAGHHAPLYQEFLRRFPSYRPEGGELLTDPSLLALGWQRKTDNFPVIVHRIDNFEPDRQAEAALAARALSLTLANDEVFMHADSTQRKMRFSKEALDAVHIDRR